MAKSKWGYLLATQILSAISVIILIVSFSTDYWVSALSTSWKKKCVIVTQLIKLRN